MGRPRSGKSSPQALPRATPVASTLTGPRACAGGSAGSHTPPRLPSTLIPVTSGGLKEGNEGPPKTNTVLPPLEGGSSAAYASTGICILRAALTHLTTWKSPLGALERTEGWWSRSPAAWRGESAAGGGFGHLPEPHGTSGMGSLCTCPEIRSSPGIQASCGILHPKTFHSAVRKGSYSALKCCSYPLGVPESYTEARRSL